MKKLLLCTLLLVSVASPALANHHGKHKPSGEMIVERTGMRQVRIQELFKTGEISVSLIGNTVKLRLFTAEIQGVELVAAL